jgi:hypothetical protein
MLDCLRPLVEPYPEPERGWTPRADSDDDDSYSLSPSSTPPDPATPQPEDYFQPEGSFGGPECPTEHPIEAKEAATGATTAEQKIRERIASMRNILLDGESDSEMARTVFFSNADPATN